MELIGLIITLLVFLMFGIGIAVGLAACAIAAIMVGLGMVSSSVVVGFWKRRTLAGVQAFFVQCGLLTGAFAGAVLAYIAFQMWPVMGGAIPVLAVGAVGGSLGGLTIAWLASTAAKGIADHAWPWLQSRVTVFQRLEA